MRILAPYGYFAPEQAASSYIWTNLHEDFAKNGLDCDVYTPVPTRGITEKVRRVYVSNKKYEVWYDGKLEIKRFSLWNEPNGTLGRFLRYFAQCSILYFKMFGGKKRRYSVIFAASTPPIIGATCAMIKMHLNIPFVYNLQDIFPDSLYNNGLANKSGLLWKIGRVIENFTYKHADKIIVISEDFKKNIMAKGVPEEKIVVVYNWVDQYAVVDIPREKNKLFDAYGLDRSKFYVTYNGNIGLSQNMDMLLSVAEEFQMEYADIQFVLVGNGAYLNEVKRMVAEKELDNVHLLPFQPYEDISHVFSLGDASLVISKPGTGAASVPSKTWSIMSASRPVLANFDENELKQIVEEHNCGIFTKAGDKEAFKQSILALYNDRGKAAEMGRNGRQFVLDNLTREVGTQKYVDVIKSVVG
ncbi:MAG: glycosyltransferase family 4 protein [Parabacteroides sp.]|nr:glycosyltransferase family 4 protein [bacterium]MDY4103587.1 glycosyltransferase family 4 protein [Parabacteroides sp.]